MWAPFKTPHCGESAPTDLLCVAIRLSLRKASPRFASRKTPYMFYVQRLCFSSRTHFFLLLSPFRKRKPGPNPFTRSTLVTIRSATSRTLLSTATRATIRCNCSLERGAWWSCGVTQFEDNSRRIVGVDGRFLPEGTAKGSDHWEHYRLGTSVPYGNQRLRRVSGAARGVGAAGRRVQRHLPQHLCLGAAQFGDTGATHVRWFQPDRM